MFVDGLARQLLGVVGEQNLGASQLDISRKTVNDFSEVTSRASFPRAV